MSGIRRRLRARLGRADGERGNAIVEFCFLAILFLVPLVYIMLGVFNVQRAMYATSSAARDASRAFSLASNEDEGRAAGRNAARLAFEDQQLAADDGVVVLDCDPPGACMQPGSVLIARIRADVKLPFTGMLGGYAPSIRIETVHRTPFGDYREAAQ